MRDTIRLIAKQVKKLFPEKTVSITRFVGNYQYGQIYIGELDREVKRQLMDYTFAKRNFCIVYSQDPTKDQEEARRDFEYVCQRLEDFALHTEPPLWHKTFYDVYETTLILSFQIWERYQYTDTSKIHIMSESDFEYPSV